MPDRHVDILIPRGGAGLYKLCREQSTISVITVRIGVYHIYADDTIDFEQALPVIENAKIQRPRACNLLESLLVHQRISERFLLRLSRHMHMLGITLHTDDNVRPPIYLTASRPVLPCPRPITMNEWLSRDLNVKLVVGIDQTVEHIRHYGTQHSDSVLTQSIQAAERFVREVDSSAVYINANTRFTAGGWFGLGTEVAVITQKLPARGPMGLEVLTTYKWIGYGDNLSRP